MKRGTNRSEVTAAADDTTQAATDDAAEAELAEVLLASLYEELRRLAAAKLAKMPPGQTLQATALVHEAWLKLGGSGRRWKNRAHFFGAAAQAMRQILIDQARRKAALRHGGKQERVELSESCIVGGVPDEQLLRINDALDGLARHAAKKAELVKLRYFIGLSLKEASAILGLAEATAKDHWEYARAWLYREIRKQEQ